MGLTGIGQSRARWVGDSRHVEIDREETARAECSGSVTARAAARLAHISRNIA
jgi:hypothetical protein